MLVIGALLLISFALLLFSRIAKTRSMSSAFVLLGMAVWSVACFHGWKNNSALNALVGFPLIFFLICDLIARPILRRRVIPPCVRVRRLRSDITNIIEYFGLFSAIAFVIYLLVTGSLLSFGIRWLGLAAISIIIFLVLDLVEKTEICGNGIWQNGRLQPWEEYKYFSWKRRTEESIELRFVSKSWISDSTRLTVPFEGRQAVLQLLGANLPDLSV
jgi:hypothetical protein